MKLAILLATPGMAAAQFSPASDRAAQTLSYHLRTLASQPRNVNALIGAGQSALAGGDTNAAIGFFSRAAEVNPREARAKAGLGSALVMLERPDDALRLFGEASALGADERDLARDRGLAYDLRGDNRRAQRDYIVALKSGPDDEVTRRYALSLGISGDKREALALLEPLTKRQDPGAWRARAFVMAMTGDLSGATSIARAVMPASLAGGMTPFLGRLAALGPADRAHAVNFGTMPSDGQIHAGVQLGDPYASSSTRSASDTLIPAGDPLGAKPRRIVEADSREPRRRPGGAVVASPPPVSLASRIERPAVRAGTDTIVRPSYSPAPRVSTRIGGRIGPVDPNALPPEVRGELGSIVAVQAAALPPPSSLPVAEVPQTFRIAPVALPPALITQAPVVAPPPGRENRLASILADIKPEAETELPALPGADTPPK